MAAIKGFKGVIFTRDENPESEYNLHRYQYATSTHEDEGYMSPALILYPKDDEDVITAVNYARENGVAIAVRTGGHQYSGASSTSGDNIQLDMSQTYLGPEDFQYDEKEGTLRCGISFSLNEFNKKMGEQGLFIPHGQCSHVHLGGHVQTGGYGQITRSFGLLADHVLSFEIVTADGKKKKVDKQSDPDLFFAVFGGSPGNFGVLTHITVRPHRDKDHPLSRGLEYIYLYTEERMTRILQLVAEMANDDDFPGDFDLCVSMFSFSQKVFNLFPTLDNAMRLHHPELFGTNELNVWPPIIQILALWGNLEGAGQTYDPSFFERIKSVCDGKPVIVKLEDAECTPISKITRTWIFQNVREFDIPYVKRACYTNSTTLVEDKWAEWMAGRIHELQSSVHQCKIAFQTQPCGGKHSATFRHSGNGTAYNWRDSKLGAALDCFYYPISKQAAIDWQTKNDEEGRNPVDGKFSKQERRMLWGSFGPMNLDSVWQFYYENREKYDRLCAIKAQVDPNHVFTPNEFCVGVKEGKFKKAQSMGVNAQSKYDENMVHLWNEKRVSI